LYTEEGTTCTHNKLYLVMEQEKSDPLFRRVTSPSASSRTSNTHGSGLLLYISYTQRQPSTSFKELLEYLLLSTGQTTTANTLCESRLI